GIDGIAAGTHEFEGAHRDEAANGRFHRRLGDRRHRGYRKQRDRHGQADAMGEHGTPVVMGSARHRSQAAAIASQLPLFSERNSASMTRMFAIASSMPYGSAISPRTVRENASPCSWY